MIETFLGENEKAMKNSSADSLKKIITIPNILTFFRLCLIPVIVVLYLKAMHNNDACLYLWAAGVLLLSFLTDVADGFIARTFHMISNFGKIIDPIADKLTQLAMLFCLLFRFFPLMLIPLALLVIKEFISGVAVLIFMKQTGTVEGADWHGKIATFLLYAMMLMHLVWFDIPQLVSLISVLICTLTMLVSFVLYMIRNLRPVIKGRKEK